MDIKVATVFHNNRFAFTLNANGDYHNYDGPAVISQTGTHYWFINGKGYSYDDWKNIARKKKLECILL